MYARKTKSIKEKKERRQRKRRNMTEAEESSRGVSELSITAGNRMACSEATRRVRKGMEMRSYCFPAANKCTLNLSNEVRNRFMIDSEVSAGRIKTQEMMREMLAWRLQMRSLERAGEKTRKH